MTAGILCAISGYFIAFDPWFDHKVNRCWINTRPRHWQDWRSHLITKPAGPFLQVSCFIFYRRHCLGQSTRLDRVVFALWRTVVIWLNQLARRIFPGTRRTNFKPILLAMRFCMTAQHRNFDWKPIRATSG
jgi:hypothetical protein